MTRFLLDTNLLLGFTREAPWAIRARAEFNLGDREMEVTNNVEEELLQLRSRNADS